MGRLITKGHMMNDNDANGARGHTTSDVTTESISVIEPPVQLDTHASWARLYSSSSRSMKKEQEARGQYLSLRHLI